MKTVLADARHGRYLESYSAFLLAMLVIVIEIIAGFVQQTNWVTTAVSAMTILLLGVITLNTVAIRRGPGTAVKLFRFFPSRDGLPTLHEQLTDCRRHARIFGIQLGAVMHNLLPLIEQRAAAGVKVDLALLSAVDRDGVRLPWIKQLGYVHDFANLEDLLIGSARRLQAWHAGLEPEIKRNVVVKAFVDIPTASVAIYDPETYDSYIHVEPIMYRLNPQQRPSFWVRRADDVALFEILIKKYNGLWEAAVPIEDLTIPGYPS